MALKKTFTLITNFGTEVTFPDCYIKVTVVESTKERSKFTYGIFKSANEGLLEIKNLVFSHKLEGKNFIAQAYDHLKTLPEFAGATDC
jgi:hypothetical protein